MAQVFDAMVRYLERTYHPNGIIVYGSYADDSQNELSDFDALVIADDAQTHDRSIVERTILDVFVYSSETFQTDYDPMDFVQIYDGKVVLDRYGAANKLYNTVRDAVDALPAKSDEEIRESIDWCGKMLARTARGDAEGYFRWHWLLTESLEIFFDAKKQRYFGPKKALRTMEELDPEAFSIYTGALKAFNAERLARWIECLKMLKP